MIFGANLVSDPYIILTCENALWTMFTNYNLKFSVSSNFLMISTDSNFSISFRKSMSDSRIDGWCDALFFLLLR